MCVVGGVCMWRVWRYEVYVCVCVCAQGGRSVWVKPGGGGAVEQEGGGWFFRTWVKVKGTVAGRHRGVCGGGRDTRVSRE